MTSSLLGRLTRVLFLLLAVLLARVSSAAAAEAGPSPAPAPTSTPGNGLAWRNLGPSVGGGRVAAVSGTPLDPELFYVGTAGGGVWKSTNGAIDWRPVSDAIPAASIGAVALSPRNKDDVWVGTGEAWPRNDVIAGNGMYRSTDGGQTWKHRGLEGTAQIARIAIDPRNPEHVLVAALGSPFADSDERGVFRSDDGGETWRKTLFIGRGSGASDIAVDPAHPDIVYAGMWQFRRNAWHLTSGGDADGLYKSTDGGNTWRALSGNGLPSGQVGRIGLAIAPSDPKRIYAVIESAAGILWRSDDAGEHWALISSNTLINERPFYYSRISVDPHDENHLFSVSVVLSESHNGGKTWQLSGKQTHGDHHDIWISADGNIVLDGNDGGPAISRDGGQNWDWRKSLAVAQVYHVGYDRRKPYWLCAGLQDNGTWCGPNDTGDERGVLQSDWIRVAGGDGTWVWPDPSDPSIVWASSGGGDNGGALTRFALNSLTSTDISPFLRDQNVVAPRDLRYRFNWEAPIAFSPFERDTAYYGGNVVFRSTDRGMSWQPISPDLSRNDRGRQGLSGTPLRLDVTGAETFDTILDIAPSPLARGVIWVGTDDGNVQLTRDAGATWVNVPIPKADADSRIVAVDASHASAGRAYVTIDRHFVGDVRPYVYVTDDFGASWRTISATLEQTDFVHVVREDPVNPAVLFAGTERGVWWSENRGESWTEFPAHLPPVSVHDLRIQPDSGDLIAGTHGRGVWVFDDLRPLEHRAAAEIAGTMFFPPRDAILTARMTPTTNTRDAGSRPQAPALISFFQHTAAAAPPTIDISDRYGHVVRRLAGTREVDAERVPIVPNQAGMNRVTWDLTSDAPAAWLRAPKWNRGPRSGVPVLSGSYTVVLHRDGTTERTTIRIAADRRVIASDADELRGHAFLTGMHALLSTLDETLNVLDNIRLQLPQRATAMAQTPGNSVLATRIRAVVGQGTEIENAISSQPENSQDDDFLQDVIRERLMTLINLASRSTPTNEQIREARAIQTEADAVLARYRSFISADIMPLQRELTRAGIPLDLAERPEADPKAGPTVDERAERRSQ